MVIIFLLGGNKRFVNKLLPRCSKPYIAEMKPKEKRRKEDDNFCQVYYECIASNDDVTFLIWRSSSAGVKSAIFCLGLVLVHADIGYFHEKVGENSKFFSGDTG